MRRRIATARTVARRVAALTVSGAVWVGLMAGPAWADPARPGDVRSEVVDVTPTTPGLRADIVGGDSFLRLRVDEGFETVVLGYEDEPYLRVRADGTVEVNDRSPARWLNEDRLGATPLPATADADAQPVWRRVGGGGEVSWHDHRTHWMAPSRPDPPRRAWAVPLLVDGRAVTIQGRYAHVPPPAAWPWWAGAAAIGAAALGLGWRRRPHLVGDLVGVSGLLAAVVGSRLVVVPSGTGQGAGAIALGALAAALGFVSGRLRRKASGAAFLAGGGVALLVYAVPRVDVLRHAVLVTDLPAWADRLSVALALGLGSAAVVLGVRGVAGSTGARSEHLAPGQPSDQFGGNQPSDQLGGNQPSDTRASASGGPQDPRS